MLSGGMVEPVIGQLSILLCLKSLKTRLVKMFLVYFLNVCMNALTVHISVHRLVPVEARWFQIPGMEL